MRPVIYVTLLVWLFQNVAPHQFSDEEMAGIRYVERTSHPNTTLSVTSLAGQRQPKDEREVLWTKPTCLPSRDTSWRRTDCVEAAPGVTTDTDLVVFGCVCCFRQRIKSMFYHAYSSYLDNAFPYDELRPLTCDGQDTWGR